MKTHQQILDEFRSYAESVIATDRDPKPDPSASPLYDPKGLEVIANPDQKTTESPLYDPKGLEGITLALRDRADAVVESAVGTSIDVRRLKADMDGVVRDVIEQAGRR